MKKNGTHIVNMKMSIFIVSAVWTINDVTIHQTSREKVGLSNWLWIFKCFSWDKALWHYVMKQAVNVRLVKWAIVKVVQKSHGQINNSSYFSVLGSNSEQVVRLCMWAGLKCWSAETRPISCFHFKLQWRHVSEIFWNLSKKCRFSLTHTFSYLIISHIYGRRAVALTHSRQTNALTNPPTHTQTQSHAITLTRTNSKPSHTIILLLAKNPRSFTHSLVQISLTHPRFDSWHWHSVIHRLIQTMLRPLLLIMYCCLRCQNNSVWYFGR